MLTGESLPVERVPGDAVAAGTIATDGQLTIETTAVGAETIYGRVRSIVSWRRRRKPSPG